MSTTIEYDTDTDSELDEAQPQRHMNQVNQRVWCCCVQWRQHKCEQYRHSCWLCARDLVIVAVLLYWITTMELNKRGQVWRWAYGLEY